MKIHRLTVADALASLNSGLAGLSDAEARQRLDEFRANEVETVARKALWRKFAREFVHFFAILLWIAAALAFFAEWREPRQGMATLGAAIVGVIVGVIVINRVFSFWQAYRAGQALAALKKLLPNATKVARSGTVRQVPGDVILREIRELEGLIPSRLQDEPLMHTGRQPGAAFSYHLVIEKEKSVPARRDSQGACESSPRL